MNTLVSAATLNVACSFSPNAFYLHSSSVWSEWYVYLKSDLSPFLNYSCWSSKHVYYQNMGEFAQQLYSQD